MVPFFRKLYEEKADFIPVTHAEMTRFWISLRQGVEFVLENLVRMHGGEIFVPKIPSIRITDLATAIAPGIPQKEVGIRPGEKIHELMCPKDDSLHTIEFDRFFIITPAAIFINSDDIYFKTCLGEEGHAVPLDFEYNSFNNPDYMSVERIREFLKETEK